ncbi:MAG: DUF58 domain-containing protein [Pirellulales bacterium]
MSTTSPTELLPPDLMAQLERLELVTRKVFRGRIKGERRSKRKGQSVEFADFRNYVHGDDLRFLDWNMYARLDRLFLKLFLEEEDLHFYVLLDASESMNFGEPTKLDFGRRLAAALGFVGLIRTDRVKIETLGQPLRHRSSALRGRANVWRMLDKLEHIQPGERVSLLEGVKNFCLRNTGRGIVVLVSDLMDKDGYEVALRFLMSQRMDVYVIHVLSAEELDPDMQGDLKLVDCEDEDVAEISISAPLLARYKKTLEAFVSGAREFCTRRDMVYLLANNQLGVQELVSSYLRSRGLVR